ncbi:Ger(x)C family spore germination protein [Gracilibacillus thailandensis]|uniref:Ger(X)C family spore germination protein n=1 Tax=Gracilibacillus thailandensis TaxID=563735 RepID=A0A6N7R279_9BACI|nr:Ger(x)C family spore germination protein [Gracilibacillus thailandensis]MRI67735.1 Ger(x)C family spore germination protein [Gracilibacillus thailandensis]
MRYSILFIIISFLILLVGCYDRIELEKQSYVIVIGIDKTDKRGVYEFTYKIANPEVGSASVPNTPDEPAAEIVTVQGVDILSATYTANSIVSKRITLDQTKVIVASEELARSEDFMGVIQSTSRSPQIRRDVQLVVTKEKAVEFLNNNDPLVETRPHKYYQFMLTRAIETGIIPEATMHRFFQITEGDADLFLGIYATTENDKKEQHNEGIEDKYKAGEIPQLGGSPTQFMGSAVFKEGQMIDTIDGEETRLVHMLDKTLRMEEYIATIPDPILPEFFVSYNYSQKKEPIINIDYYPNKPTEINVHVKFQAEIIAVPSLIPYTQNLEYRKKLEEEIVKRLEDKTEAFIKKTQTEYRSDPFYWSLNIRKHFKDIKEYEKADWHKNIYPNAKINVTYELDTLEFGKMIDDSDLNEVRD